MKAVMMLAFMLMLRGSAWAESEYLLTDTVYAVSVNRSVLLPQVHVGNEAIVLKTIAMESSGRPEGMPYVAVTLINRARLHGTTLEHEALRRKQYSCWNNAKWAKWWLAKYYTPKVRLAASNALKMGMVEAVKYPDLRHYHTIGTSPYWAKGHTPVLILGGHKWYRGIK